MKKLITLSLIATFFTLSVSAQKRDESVSTQPVKQERMQKMQDQLNLTEKQKTDMKAIQEKFKTKMQDLNAEKLTKEERMSKRKDLQKEKRAEMNKILTLEQQTKMKEMRENHEGKFGNKGNRGNHKGKMNRPRAAAENK